jgi:hypothetical protein
LLRRAVKLTFQQLKERSNKFVAQLDTHIAEIVNFNEDLEELNRKQLRESKLADGNNISRPYSRRYAIWKQHFYPQSYTGKVNLLLTGTLYQSLEIKARGRNEYFINTDVSYGADLFDKYGNYLGIAPENQPKAQEITGKLLAEKYNKLVLA